MTYLCNYQYLRRKIDEILGTPKTAVLEDEDRAYQGYTHRFIDLNVSTKNISAYTAEPTKESVLS